MSSTTTVASASATSVQIFNRYDKQAESASDSKIDEITLLLGRCGWDHGAGTVNQKACPPERVIYNQPLPPTLYHPKDHLAKPKYIFTNPDFVPIVLTVTKNTSAADREYIKSLKKELAALKAARVRAKRHPVRRAKNWTETKTPPVTDMAQPDTPNMIPDIIVTRPSGKIRYLEDRNTYI